jgi:hypothetical protein
MNFFRCFASMGYALGRTVAWIYTRVTLFCHRIGGLLCSAVHSAASLLRSAWQHPVVTTKVVGLGVAWLYLGLTPLLSAIGVVVLLGLVVRFTIGMYCWLYRRLIARSLACPVPPPVNPQRNGRPVNRTANPAFAGAV